MSEQNGYSLLVIPARKGSSFKDKNIRELAGKTLLHYAFDSSFIKQPHHTIVTSDCSFILEDAASQGFLVHKRKPHLSNHTATLDQVMTEIAKVLPGYKNYICLPPTAPLRTSKHVEDALSIHINSKADSTISVKEEYKSIWKHKPNGFASPLVERMKNRQEVEPVYICNGAIFITTSEMLITQKRRMCGRVALYVMDDKSSLDVHGEDDLKLGEYLING